MSEYQVPRKVIPRTPEAAGLPSDDAVTRQLRAIVVARQPVVWPEPALGAGDGNYYRGDVFAPRPPRDPAAIGWVGLGADVYPQVS
ncbi:MAG TPA: hypothetical protein VL737_03840 [Candidatus Pristimantibacillus sp.]|jgi:hypothetical protein|nr:hypothetical protein [Candidatus Pristimantibacillus sp.]